MASSMALASFVFGSVWSTVPKVLSADSGGAFSGVLRGIGRFGGLFPGEIVLGIGVRVGPRGGSGSSAMAKHTMTHA
jgi:hypothetical protein